MSIISFVILDVLYSLSTQQRYKQSALRKKELIAFLESTLTISGRRPLSYRNQSIDLLRPPS